MRLVCVLLGKLKDTQCLLPPSLAACLFSHSRVFLNLSSQKSGCTHRKLLFSAPSNSVTTVNFELANYASTKLCLKEHLMPSLSFCVLFLACGGL